MKRPRYVFDVTIGFTTYSGIIARTPGAAVRKAVRQGIRRKALKRQPRTDSDGWFEGVHINPR